MSDSGKGDSLGDRMKGYELTARQSLPRRLPVILRIDGKAFHTFTRGMQRPFDDALTVAMDAGAVEICEEAQGAVFAFVQSDEISVLLHNYRRLQTEAWFDNQIQKMVSVAASVASSSLSLRYNQTVLFDARAFVLPEAEVCNYFLWRQQDATRNSIQMLARSLRSHAECNNKNTRELQELCFACGHNWNDLATHLKRGRCVLRDGVGWSVDREPPIFSQDRDYVNRHLAIEADPPKANATASV